MASLLGWLGRTAKGIERQVNPFDNGATYKQQTPVSNQSVGQQASTLGRGLVHPFSTFGSAVAHVPQTVYREVQNKPIGSIQQSVFGTQDQGNIAKQIIGDTATIGLTAAAPGISRFAGDVAGSVFPNLASKGAINALRFGGGVGDTAAGRLLTNTAIRAPITASLPTRIATGALANQALNTGFGVAGQVGSGQKVNIGQAAKQALGPTAIGIGSELAPHAINAIKNNPLNEVGAVGKDVKMPESNKPISNPNLKEYYDAKIGELKSMDGHNVSMNKETGVRTTDNSSVYSKLYANRGRPPTNQDYVDYIHEQNMAGKPVGFADKSEVALYKNLLKESASKNPPTPVSAVGKNIPEQPNLNKGAFSAKDRANLDKQIAAEKAKIPTPTGVPTKPPETANLTQAQRQNLINNDALQQTKNKVEINPAVGNTKGAVAQATGIADELRSRLDRAASLASKLNSHDQALLSERADKNVSIKPNNPEAFAKASAAHSDAFDYSLAAQRAAGGTTLRFGGGNYHPLYLEATTAKMDALGIPQADRIQKGKFTGFQDTTRKYRGYTDAGKVGLKPLNSSPVEDIKMYNQKSAIPIRNATLRAALEKSNPGEVTATGMGVGRDGKPFRQAAGANLPFNVSENVDKNLNNFKRAYVPESTAGKVALEGTEKVNAGAKRALWFGSLFHYPNELKNFVGSNLFHPVVVAKGVGRAVVSATSNEGWNGILDRARTTKVNGTSVLEGARAMGVELPGNSRLNRVTSAYSLTQAEAALQKGIDPNSVEGVNAGRLINKIAGQKNAAVQGSNPTIDRIVSAGAAAPKWTPSQLKLVIDAFTKPGIGRFTEGGGARNVLLGARALEAGLAIGGSAALAGRLPTAKEAQQQAGLSLNNPVPNVQLNSKNSKGEGQVMNFPTDPTGLAVGLATNPGHFLQSRFSPGLSFATKVATNKNWNDQPLADPNKPNYGLNLVKNAALNSVLPIGVQNFTNFQKNPNNPSIAQGLLQEVGGRLKTNPNDPRVVDTKDYINNQNKFVSSLNKNEAALFNTVNPTKKDAGGNIVYNPDIFQKADTYAILASNHSFTDKYQSYQQSQKNHDPVWDLLRNQLQSVLTLRSGKSLPGQTYTKAGVPLTQATGTDQQWYKDLLAEEQTYFSSLPKSTTPSTPVDYGPQANAYVNQQLNAKNYKDPQVQKYFNDRAAYENSQRAQQGGLKPIAQFGQVGQPGQLDNPAQLAITPKGSSYGTGAPKAKTASTRVRGAKAKATKTPSYKAVASIKAPKLPKGIKVNVPRTSFKAPKTRKLAVSKIPSSYTRRKLA